MQGTGANFLLAGIYFTFLFSLLIMFLTTAHFLVGSAVEKVAGLSFERDERIWIRNVFRGSRIQIRPWFCKVLKEITYKICIFFVYLVIYACLIIIYIK